MKIESRTNLLFSFEKMALRDAVRDPAGARLFAEGLYDFTYGKGSESRKFERWCEVVAALPRKQTRVLTWPVEDRLKSRESGVASLDSADKTRAFASYLFQLALRPRVRRLLILSIFADEPLATPSALEGSDSPLPVVSSAATIAATLMNALAA